MKRLNSSDVNCGPLSDTISIGSLKGEEIVLNFDIVVFKVILFSRKISGHLKKASIKTKRN